MDLPELGRGATLKVIKTHPDAPDRDSEQPVYVDCVTGVAVFFSLSGTDGMES